MGENICVYPVDAGYVVADDGGWIPGTYATPEEAFVAAVLYPEEEE